MVKKQSDNQNKVTVPSVTSAKDNKKKLTATTAYDYTFARLVDSSDIDIILVGDSLATVVQGEESTLPVTLDEMIYHARLVARGAERALVVADMPFLSYQISPEEAVRAAGRLLKEGRAEAVKLEGGSAIAPTIRKLTAVDIPVVGHIGLTPQSYHRMGGYRVQGKDAQAGVRSAQELLEDARAVEEAGAFAIVLEGIPAELAGHITTELAIPTIGIGAGPDCDGQILVMHESPRTYPGKDGEIC